MEVGNDRYLAHMTYLYLHATRRPDSLGEEEEAYKEMVESMKKDISDLNEEEARVEQHIEWVRNVLRLMSEDSLNQRYSFISDQVIHVMLTPSQR